MGVLDHLSEYFDCSSHGSKHKKRKQLQVKLLSLQSRSKFLWDILV